MTEPLPPSPLLPLCGQSLSTQHGTPEATGSRPAPSATPRQGHTSALPRVSRSASLPGEGLGAWSLTSGSSDHSAGRSWPRRVDAVGRPGVFSWWLENFYEREEGEAPPSPFQPLPPTKDPFLWSSGVQAASALTLTHPMLPPSPQTYSEPLACGTCTALLTVPM